MRSRQTESDYNKSLGGSAEQLAVFLCPLTTLPERRKQLAAGEKRRVKGGSVINFARGFKSPAEGGEATPL